MFGPCAAQQSTAERQPRAREKEPPPGRDGDGSGSFGIGRDAVERRSLDASHRVLLQVRRVHSQVRNKQSRSVRKANSFAPPFQKKILRSFQQDSAAGAGDHMGNEKIRVGLVGYGTAGSVFHAPLIGASPRLELSGILTSRDIPMRVESVAALIERSDLLVIASPNQTHFPIAKEILQAGKHVVVDKPMALDVAEADELISLSEQSKLLLCAFHNRRWDSDFLTVRRQLHRLGDIMLVEAHWDRFRPAPKAGWKEVAGPGSGLLSDLGPHLIDQTLVLFGMPDALEADIIAQRDTASVDDYFELTLHYGRARMILGSSTLVAAPRPRFALHGTGGSFVKYGLDRQEGQLKAGLDPAAQEFGLDQNNGIFTDPSGKQEAIVSERGNYLAFYEGVADAILNGGALPVSPGSARNGIALIELARRSAAEGRRISVS